jgi:hypothetical protein
MAILLHAASLLARTSSSSLTNEAAGMGDVGLVVDVDPVADDDDDDDDDVATRYAVDGDRSDRPS